MLLYVALAAHTRPKNTRKNFERELYCKKSKNRGSQNQSPFAARDRQQIIEITILRCQTFCSTGLTLQSTQFASSKRKSTIKCYRKHVRKKADKKMKLINYLQSYVLLTSMQDYRIHQRIKRTA